MNEATCRYRPQKLTIFLSYGHGVHEVAAKEIKLFFEKRGHDVWFDTDRLGVGGKWEERITAGIERAQRAGKAGRVILLQERHGVRRPNGYCLNEVSASIQRHIICVPVLLSDSEPPDVLTQLKVPYFDWRDLFQSAATSKDIASVAKSPAFLHRCELLANVVELLNVSQTIVWIEMLRSLLYSIAPDHVFDCVDRVLPGGDAVSAGSLAARKVSGRVLIIATTRCAPLALALKRDLSAAGLEPYFNEHAIGDDSCIEEGLNFVSDPKKKGEGRVVLLMTPESVSRPSGRCLDTVMAALGKGLDFVPLMVRLVDPPLSLCRIQWLDVKQCVTEDDDAGFLLNETVYASKFPAILKAIVDGTDSEGQQSRLLAQLQPFSFDSEISRHLNAFTGRKWTLQKVLEWVRSSSSVLWLTGKRGTGKTAFCSWLSRSLATVKAMHFSGASPALRDGRRAVMSIAFQLEASLGLGISKVPLEELLPVAETGLLIQKLLIDPLCAVHGSGSGPVLVLLDGADWMDPLFVETLVGKWKLVKSAKLLVCGCDSPLLRGPMRRAAVLDLEGAENVKDLDAFLHQSLTALNHGSPPPQATVDQIVMRAEGMFLYAAHILQGLQSGQLSLAAVSEWPVGLQGLLAQFVKSQFSDPRHFETALPMLQILCAAVEPLTKKEIQSVLRWPEHRMHHAFCRIGSLFLENSAAKFAPFHSSLILWLLNKAPPHLRVSALEGHLALALWAARKVAIAAASDLPLYIRRHGLFHAAECKIADPRVLPQLQESEEFMMACRVLSFKDRGLGMFFHGAISRAESHKRLRGLPAGAFLVRYSQNARCCCVSFVVKRRSGLSEIQHNLLYHIQRGEAHVGFSIRESPGPGDPLWKDLHGFVEAYQQRGLLTEAIPAPVPERRPMRKADSFATLEVPEPPAVLHRSSSEGSAGMLPPNCPSFG